MDYGICHLSIVPMRSGNSHESELVSQLLYGDCFKILSEKNGWLQIKSLIDSYIGWINDKQVKEISKVNAEKITFDHKIFSTRIIDYIETDENILREYYDKIVKKYLPSKIYW